MRDSNVNVNSCLESFKQSTKDLTQLSESKFEGCTGEVLGNVNATDAKIDKIIEVLFLTNSEKA